ncbi:MAG: hypothetical protein IIA59_06165 [Candidatus Marinimicrobia bacterium]|nr:hypothetical protein [Candidatus Neomarinimicrobiota bacterium]
MTDLQQIAMKLDRLERLIMGRPDSPWLTSREAASYLRCSISKVESLTARGLLSYRRLDPTAPKSPRLYISRQLDAYVVTGKNPTTHRLTPLEKQEVEELLR